MIETSIQVIVMRDEVLGWLYRQLFKKKRTSENLAKQAVNVFTNDESAVHPVGEFAVQ